MLLRGAGIEGRIVFRLDEMTFGWMTSAGGEGSLSGAGGFFLGSAGVIIMGGEGCLGGDGSLAGVGCLGVGNLAGDGCFGVGNLAGDGCLGGDGSLAGVGCLGVGCFGVGCLGGLIRAKTSTTSELYSGASSTGSFGGVTVFDSCISCSMILAGIPRGLI